LAAGLPSGCDGAAENGRFLLLGIGGSAACIFWAEAYSSSSGVISLCCGAAVPLVDIVDAAVVVVVAVAAEAAPAVEIVAAGARTEAAPEAATPEAAAAVAPLSLVAVVVAVESER
jgi:hypothetical protein